MRNLLHRKHGEPTDAQREISNRQDDALKSAKGLFKTAVSLALPILEVDPTCIGKAVVGSTLLMINELQVRRLPMPSILLGHAQTIIRL